jgi:hypothetical protein
MSRALVVYPPEMLPCASDPETAEVIEPDNCGGLIVTVFTANSPKFTRQLPRRFGLH